MAAAPAYAKMAAADGSGQAARNVLVLTQSHDRDATGSHVTRDHSRAGPVCRLYHGWNILIMVVCDWFAAACRWVHVVRGPG